MKVDEGVELMDIRGLMTKMNLLSNSVDSWLAIAISSSSFIHHRRYYISWVVCRDKWQYDCGNKILIHERTNLKHMTNKPYPILVCFLGFQFEWYLTDSINLFFHWFLIIKFKEFHLKRVRMRTCSREKATTAATTHTIIVSIIGEKIHALKEKMFTKIHPVH